MCHPLAVTTLLLFSTAFILSAGPFVNGSFELGTGLCFTATGFTNVTSANDCITGWSIPLGNIDYIHNLWQAANGTHSLDLNGTAPGAVQQTFDTINNLQYLVSFSMAANTGGLPVLKQLTVDAAGQSQVFTFSRVGHSNASMGWVTDTFRFIAHSSSTTLTFTSNTPGAAGPALDAVSVVAPEPGSTGLLISGVALLILWRRSLRRRLL
jgi:choice-of-anchor C domain-containing protein